MTHLAVVPGLPMTPAVNAALIEQFSAWQHGRNFSPSTIRRRRGSLASFGRWMAPAGIIDAAATDVEDWVATLVAPRTKHAYRSDLNAFYAWAQRRRLAKVNPVALTDSVRVPKGLPRPVPAEMLPGILACAPDDDTRLMVALAAYAGLRCAEISHLSTDDVSLAHVPAVLVVRKGKGGKDRAVPVHPALAALLARRRTSGQFFDLRPDTVGERVSRHLRNCGIDATCHQLRHTFCTELAAVLNGNIVAMMLVMGHDSASTTMGYMGWAGGEVAEAVARMYAA